MARLALIVATRDRAALLRRMLASALAMRGADRDAFALVVADDGSRDRTREVVAEAAARHPNVRWLPVAEGGKSRALNAAIRATDAPILAFTDDDVELDPSWLVAVDAYVGRTGAAAAQGAIRLPPEVAADALLVSAVERWRTVPTCDFGPTATDARSFIGANMIVTRALFERVGLFDERLGPGASGADEDKELALRVRAAGVGIGWIADAIVYHSVDPARLCARYFRTLHEQRGRSRAQYTDASRLRIAADCGIAAFRVGTATLVGNLEARRRALARWYHYRAMLAATQVPRPGGVPRLDGAASAS